MCIRPANFVLCIYKDPTQTKYIDHYICGIVVATTRALKIAADYKKQADEASVK